MDKVDYLEYLDRLYDRINDTGKRTGLTRWALAAVVGYVVLALLEDAQHVADLETTLLIAVFLYFQQIGMLLLFAYMVTWLATGDGSSLTTRDAISPVRDLLEVGLIFGPVIYVSLVKLFNFPPHTSAALQLPGFSAAAYSISLFAIFSVGVLVAAHTSVQRAGFPSAWIVAHKQDSRLPKALSFLIAMLLAVWLFVEVCQLLGFLGPAKAAEYVRAASYFLVLYWCIVTFVLTTARGRTLQRIASIERRIVLEDIDDIEIRKAIKSELSGVPPSEWFLECVNEVAALDSKIRLKIDEGKSMEVELQTISPDYQYERAARAQRYIEELTAMCTDFTRRTKRLMRWVTITRFMPSIRADVYDAIRTGLPKISLATHTIEEATELISKFRKTFLEK